MTAIDRMMPPPHQQRETAQLAAKVQQAMSEAGLAKSYLIGPNTVAIVELHRYTAECVTYDVTDNREVTFLVPLPKENWP